MKISIAQNQADSKFYRWRRCGKLCVGLWSDIRPLSAIGGHIPPVTAKTSVSKLCDCYAASNSLGNCDKQRSEPRGRGNSRIKARRLAPPRRITSARSAGRRSGNPRFSGNCHHVFRAFVQLVMCRQIWGTDARFDLLFPSTLTTATNLAVSTVAWQRNSRFL